VSNGTGLATVTDSSTRECDPFVLTKNPVADIIWVVDNVKLTRSRTKGFDYVGFSNSLVFIGMSISKNSQVVASYRRWVKQAVLK